MVTIKERISRFFNLCELQAMAPMTQDEKSSSNSVLKISLRTKKKYIGEFTEDEFRDKVVHPLFVAKGMNFGKDVCGPDEQGKDCYFWSQHPVVGRTLTVVQTKRGKLNLSRKPVESVMEAATQLKTAIATKVSDPKNGTEMLPSAAILVASGEINTPARQHITSQVNDGRLSFLDVDDIVPMIDDLMPEFWNGIDADKLPYLKALRSQLLELSESIDVSELGINIGTPSPITDESFVQLFLHRYRPKLKKHSGRSFERMEREEIRIDEIFSKKQTLVLITGEAGSGKTTSLQRLAMIGIDKALDDPKSPIPIYMSVEVLAHPDASLLDIATEITRAKSTEGKAAFSHDDLVAGKIIFLIDGLDELADEDARLKALEAIKACNDRYPKCHIVLTSRDHPFIKQITANYAFAHYHISPLSFNQVGNMIKRLSQGKSLSSHDTQEMLRRLQNVHGIQLNPLLVTIFVATSDYARTDIPANITELFKKFTEIMLGRWHLKKGFGQQFHQPLKDFVLRRLAFHLHKERHTSLLLSECKAVIERELVDRGHRTDFESLFHEIVYSSGLLRVEDDEVSFRHLMLQEFFAGRGIESKDFARQVVSDPWWSKALIFYFGEHPDDQHTLNELRQGIEDIVGGDRFQAAVTIGLASQACYLILTEQKKEAIRWVIENLSKVKDETIAEFSGGHENLALFSAVQYFAFGRDAVAGRIIGEIAVEEWERIGEDCSLTEMEESRLFWCIAGLIESRQLPLALEMTKSFHPKDVRLLLGLHMCAYYVKDAHVTSDSDKSIAEYICKNIEPRIEELQRQFMKEMKGLVFEVRQGLVKAIDDESIEKLQE